MMCKLDRRTLHLKNEFSMTSQAAIFSYPTPSDQMVRETKRVIINSTVYLHRFIERLITVVQIWVECGLDCLPFRHVNINIVLALPQ